MSTERVLELLESINASLKVLVGAAKARQASAPKPIASDRDLDGKFGDPVLKFTPRDWTGASYKNRRFSECPPALLDMIAESCDYFAKVAEEKKERTNSGKPVAPYKLADAARARGWAKRIRDGKHVQTTEPLPARDAGEGDEEGWASDPGGWS